MRECDIAREVERGCLGKAALKLGDVAGGGRYVTRFVEITYERSQEWISPDETRDEAAFFRPDGVRIELWEKIDPA